MKRIIMLALLLPLAASADKDQDDMKPYPAAEEGCQRMVFRVPVKQNEADHKVQIMVGRTLPVDCNQTWFMGRLQKQVAKGWGYPYFVVEKVAGLASTMMACPPSEDKTEAFVSVRGELWAQNSVGFRRTQPFPVAFRPSGIPLIIFLDPPIRRIDRQLIEFL